jgi:hypothetical protein
LPPFTQSPDGFAKQFNAIGDRGRRRKDFMLNRGLSFSAEYFDNSDGNKVGASSAIALLVAKPII